MVLQEQKLTLLCYQAEGTVWVATSLEVFQLQDHLQRQKKWSEGNKYSCGQQLPKLPFIYAESVR